MSAIEKHPSPLRHRSKKSIAVLPFINRSVDPDNEYFSDGITEEIINALAKDQGLKVIARTSSFAYKGKSIDVRTIGKQLGVANVLEGSVRKIKDRVRITAQLVNTEDGAYIWSKNFDRQLDDIFALQDEVSLLIADQIRENFGHFEISEPTPKAPTQNIAAYELLLKGSYFFKRKGFEDIQKALDYFQQAITLDPNYAEAYAFLGETYLHYGGFGLLNTEEAHAKARAAAQKAIILKATEPRAHKVLAYIHLFYDWNWEAALAEYNTAISCGLANENEFITYYYIFIEKDFDRAIEVARQVLETDPLHVISHWQLGLCYYFAQRFEEALQAFDNALTFDPNFGEALRWKGLVLGYLGRFEEAINAINQALHITNGQGLAQLDLLMVKILMNEKAEVLAAIESMEFIDPTDPAMLYTMLNMPDAAISWLEKGYQERSVMMVSLKHYWVWDNIRQDARFQAIYERMHFSMVSLPSDRITISEVPLTIPANALMEAKEVLTFVQRLQHSMEVDRLFSDPALSLRQVAETIELHPNKLSWLLNEHLGKNFNEYINSYRLDLFKQKALDPANSHLTLLGLAYESGFNSKTVFNAFFKKMEHTTPRSWVKTHKSQA